MKPGSLVLENSHPFKELHCPFQLKPNEHSNFVMKDAPGFIFIKEGFMRIGYKRSSHVQTVRIAGPGEIVGFGNWKYPDRYVAIALSLVNAVFIDKDLFEKQLSTDPLISKEIFDVSIFQVMLRDERICTLQNPTVRGRIAGTLVSLSDKFGKYDAQGRLEILAIVDRKILAELSSTVVETLARTLTEFENKGIIERQGKTIFILNYPALLQVSDA